jgi:hypothetical protein
LEHGNDLRIAQANSSVSGPVSNLLKAGRRPNRNHVLPFALLEGGKIKT